MPQDVCTLSRDSAMHLGARTCVLLVVQTECGMGPVACGNGNQCANAERSWLFELAWLLSFIQRLLQRTTSDTILARSRSCASVPPGGGRLKTACCCCAPRVARSGEEGCGNKSYVDLWDTDHPAERLNGTGWEGGYEEALFGERALSILRSHPIDTPLYVLGILLLCMHNLIVEQTRRRQSTIYIVLWGQCCNPRPMTLC